MHFSGGRKLWPFMSSSLLKFFATIILFAALSLMFIYYGAVLQKNQTMAKIQQLVFNAAETKLSVFNNYIFSAKFNVNFIWRSFTKKSNYVNNATISIQCCRN